MAQLPTEQAIGPLPDSPPRRMGVGAWQPGDLARGAQDIARGGETLGLDLGMYAGQQQRLVNEAQTTAAKSAITTANIQTHGKMSQDTNPDNIPQYRQTYQDNLDSGLAGITDPNERKKVSLEMAPEIARFQVAADDHQHGLIKDNTIAGLDGGVDNDIKSALSIPDDDVRNTVLKGINDKLTNAVKQGWLTQQEGLERGRMYASQYAKAAHDADVQAAQPRIDPVTGAYIPGDVSKLQRHQSLYTFGPEAPGWNGSGGGAPQSPVDAPAQRVAAYAAPIQSAASKYGVSPSYLAKTAYIESRGDPSADNGFARGFMQFSDGTARQYGVDQKDAASSIDGAARYAVDNRAVLTKALGRAPTDAELYIAHQQDGATAAKLLANPDTPAGQLVNPTAIKNNGGDPNAPAKQFTDMWINKFNSTPTAVGGGTATGGGQPARAVGDSIARGVGGVTGAMNAATGANPSQVLSLINGQDVTTTHKDANGKTITETAKGLTDADLKSGPIVLSTGASNDPMNAPQTGAQLAALKARGVDMSNVTILGVGNRADFQQANVNTILKNIAEKYGAKFQPLDAGMIGPDGVHPVPQGYKAIAQQIGGAASGGGPNLGGATVQNASFPGLPPAGATGPNPHIAPPQDQWPPDARGVEHNPDGSLSYIMDEGNRVPVPGSRATGAYGAPSPGKTGTILDFLRPVERAELGIQNQQEILRIQAENSAHAKFHSEAGLSDLKKRTEDMVAGNTDVGPREFGYVQSQYANSPDPNLREAYTKFAMVHANIQDLQNLSPADVETRVAQQKDYLAQIREASPDSVTVQHAEALLDSSQKFLARYNQDIKDRPLVRAAAAKVIPSEAVQPLNPNDPNLAGAIKTRNVAVDMTNKAFKTNAPFFLEGEGGSFARGLAANPAAISAINDPTVINRMADDKGFQTAIDGLTRSGNPDSMAGAFKVMNMISQVNPLEFESRFKGAAPALDLWNNLLVNMDPKAAAERMEKINDPSFATTRKYREEEADRSLKALKDTDVLKVFDQSSWVTPWTKVMPGPGAPTSTVDVPTASLGAMRSDYVKAYKNYFVMDPNPATAADSAAKAVAKNWGPSQLMGGTVMRTPPDARYPAINGSHDYLVKALDDDVKKLAGDRGDESTVVNEVTGEAMPLYKPTPEQNAAQNMYHGKRVLISDSATQGDVDAGRLPTYQVVVQDPQGMLQVLKDPNGQPHRFPSDDFRSQLASAQTGASAGPPQWANEVQRGLDLRKSRVQGVIDAKSTLGAQQEQERTRAVRNAPRALIDQPLNDMGAQ